MGQPDGLRYFMRYQGRKTTCVMVAALLARVRTFPTRWDEWVPVSRPLKDNKASRLLQVVPVTTAQHVRNRDSAAGPSASVHHRTPPAPRLQHNPPAAVQPRFQEGGVLLSVQVDYSCVLCSISTHQLQGHNISFFIAQQRLIGTAARLHEATDLILKDHDYCVVLWNDDRDKHSSTRMGGSGGIEHGYEAAARDGPHVDTSGLGVTMRRAHDTFEFRKQVLSVITKCFLDLTVSCLCPARGACKEKSVTEFEAAADPEGDDSFARAHKLAVVDAYLFVDRREAETSIGYFALQLLTVPSASVHPVRNHKLVSRILAIIEDKHIVYLPHNRRAHLFHMYTAPVQSLIIAST
ncbi:hypothetical protein GGX14DRAFT_573173 [Mycena pura]|uniref:Uncharacterized protein n=1 Tax=Mycena pura TaxID=153505 RepID=A0AAD6UZU8_9AGAR|nr:hypothetical protein GGX14DRAFT_573173 [Mycena pura]